MREKPFEQRTLSFSSSVPVYVSWRRSKETVNTPLAYHPAHEFHFIKRGHGAYYIEGKTYNFGPRNLVIIRPNQIHSFIPRIGDWLERAQILFLDKWLGDVFRSLDIDKTFPSLICLPNSPAVHIEMIVNHILEEKSRREEGWEEMIGELLHEFLLWVRRVKNHPVKSSENKPLYTQLRQYVELHFADPQCTVTWIAKQFGYSLNYLSTLFKEASGIGIKQYLLQHRIIAARQIIDENTGLKMEAIARQVGFDQYRNFNRVFFALTGVSPATYRKNCHPHRKK